MQILCCSFDYADSSDWTVIWPNYTQRSVTCAVRRYSRDCVVTIYHFHICNIYTFHHLKVILWPTWMLSVPPHPTGCNRIRHTTLKIYFDQTNSNITTQFLTEHLLTLQIFFTSVQYGCHWLCGRHPYDFLINAVALIGVTFLDKLWDELEYRLDVCHITSGSHIENL
jgi:hypothetical protein